MPGHNDWILKSQSDLKSARKLFKDDDETLDTAAYHTQQCDDVVVLIPYATDSRYPDDFFVVTRSDVEQAIAIAYKVLRFVMVKLEADPNMRIF